MGTATVPSKPVPKKPRNSSDSKKNEKMLVSRGMVTDREHELWQQVAIYVPEYLAENGLPPVPDVQVGTYRLRLSEEQHTTQIPPWKYQAHWDADLISLTSSRNTSIDSANSELLPP